MQVLRHRRENPDTRFAVTYTCRCSLSTLPVDVTLAPEAVRGFEPHLAKADASRVPNSLLLFCFSNCEASTVLSGRQPHSPLEHLPIQEISLIGRDENSSSSHASQTRKYC